MIFLPENARSHDNFTNFKVLRRIYNDFFRCITIIEPGVITIIELGVITIIEPGVITIIEPEVFINKFKENLARRQILKLFKHKEKR